MTFGSLFAGIGGFDLGLQRAGMTPLWQVEIDPFCRAVLAEHWPEVKRYGDIREVHARGLCGTREFCDGCLASVDVLCGGFPCQDISFAGRGDGITGERSGLWTEYARLIRELRPRYVLVENVAALLVRGLGDVLGSLAALGYDAEWDCLPASAFGAPHRRDRLWLVAYPSGARRREIARGAYGDEGQDAWRRETQTDVANGDGQRRDAGLVADASVRRVEGEQLSTERREVVAHLDGRGASLPDAENDGTLWGRGVQSHDCRAFRFDGQGKEFNGFRQWWATEPDLGRVADGVPARVDRLRGLGNAVVPQIPEWLGRQILAYEEGVIDSPA